MSAPIQRIMNNLQRFKQIEQKPDTLAARHDAMQKLMVDIT